MKLTPEYFSGQGILTGYKKAANGLPLGGFDFGQVKDLQFTIQTNVTEYPDNRLGSKTTDLTIENSIVTGLSFTALQLNTRLLMEYFRGVERDQDVAPVVARAFTDAAPAVGDLFTLNADGVTGLVIEDSTSGTAKTLTLGTNYTYDVERDTGQIVDLTSGGPFVGPFKWSGTPAAQKTVGLIAAPQNELFLTFSGINVIPGIASPKGIVRLYRTALEMPANMPFVSDARMEMAMKASVKQDPNMPIDPGLGYTGRISGFGLTA